MRKIIILNLLFAFILHGCSSSGSSSDNNNNPSTCANVSSFTVTQEGQNIDFELARTATPLFYQVSVINSDYSLIPDNGNIYTIPTASYHFTIDELNLEVGKTYVFFIRSTCDDTSKSDWSSPKSLTIQSFCYSPFDLSVQGHSLVWSTNTTSATQYQVEYGVSGFTRGTGTIRNVNSTELPYIQMQENIIYDFYVRSYCNGSLGWSAWSDVYSYLCPIGYNACNLPSNVRYSVSRNFFNQPTGALVSWNFNGETQFEYTLVGLGQSPNSGAVNSCGAVPEVYIGLTQDTNYYFYIRAICGNGNRTNWVGPMTINIGH